MEGLSVTIGVGDTLKWKDASGEFIWMIMSVGDKNVGITCPEKEVMDRPYPRRFLDSENWSRVGFNSLTIPSVESLGKIILENIAKCPSTCTPRTPCLGPVCPGRRESGMGFELWSKRQLGLNSLIEDYPLSERHLNKYRECGAVLMSRGELRCARDMACPLFRSK